MRIACFESNHSVYVFLFCAIVLYYLLYQKVIQTLFILSYLILPQIFTVASWSLIVDDQFHPTRFNECN